MRRWLVVLGVIFAGSAEANDKAKFQPTQIDPTLGLLQRQIAHYGSAAPIFGAGLRRGVDLSGTAALVEWTQPPSAEDLSKLEGFGIEFRASVGRIQSIWLPFRAVERLVEFPITRVEAAWTPFILAPLDVTTAEVGADVVRRVPELGFDGKGVVVADIDSGIDPTHPHFFHANGGIYTWLDVNANGVFDTGDSVDLDGDGIADRNEVLRVLDASAVHLGQTENADGVFQADLDWLYADSNQDRTRNAGLEDGFTEDDPAFGEPIFVIDDVNTNGQLDLGEHLVRLGDSKIRVIVDGSQRFTRGENLLTVTESVDFPFSYHGTGVGSILVGGQAPHRRQGVAPGAELLAYAAADPENLNQNFSTAAQFDAVADAVSLGAKVILHEWTDPFRAPQDGSTLFEQAMQQTRDEGVFHVTPVGNLNLARKHIEVLATDSATLAFEVPRPSERLPTVDRLFGSLMWQSTDATVRISGPEFGPVDLLPNVTTELSPGVFADSTAERTSRGYAHIQFFVWRDDGATLPIGEWQLSIAGLDPGDTVFGRVTDYASGWAPGVVWVNPTVDRGTIVYPSTGDAAFGVGAYGGRWNDVDGSDPGQVRLFSGRGPRVDGRPVVQLVAPDDPYAAISATPEFLESGYQRHWLATFGGTSGAGPHVAGAVALLLQAGVTDPNILAQTLTTSAVSQNVDSSFGSVFPNDTVGFGKLDVLASLGGQRPAANAAPAVDGSARIAEGFATIEVVGEDADEDVLEYRFDVDYDGVFDTQWGPASRWSGQPFEATYARVSVRDRLGNTSGRLLVWESSTPMEPEVPRPPPQDCEGCSATAANPSFFWVLGLLLVVRLRRFGRGS